MSRKGKRGARGTKGRMASPAQMERLRAVLGMQLPNPVPFENWRYHMRSHRNPEANSETREAAWAHANRPTAADIAMWQVVTPLLQAMHEEALTRDAQEAP